MTEVETQSGPFYHFTQLRLSVGAIIQPGNYGRLLKRYCIPKNGVGFGNPWILCRELIFEDIRSQTSIDLPPRSSACFVFPSLDEANAYRAINDPFFCQVLHEVEVIDPGKSKHHGRISLLDIPNAGEPFLDCIRTKAIAYWNGGGDGSLEMLTTSEIKVVRCLE